MPRITKAAEAAAVKPNTLVIDNGGWSMKAGLVNAHPSLENCHTVPNCLARDQDRHVYVGAQLSKCKDFYHVVLRRPVERGVLVNWELERAIWHQTFFSEKEAQVKVCVKGFSSTILVSLSLFDVDSVILMRLI
jgi:actin-related protein 6